MKSLTIMVAAAMLAAVSPQQKQKIEAEASTDAAFLVAYSAMQEAPRPTPVPPAPKPDGLPINQPKVGFVASPIVLASLAIDAADCETCRTGPVGLATSPNGLGGPGPVRRLIADGPVRRVARRLRDERPARRFLGRLFCRGCQ